MSSSATYERLVVPYVHCGSPSAPRATDATRSVVAALEGPGGGVEVAAQPARVAELAAKVAPPLGLRAAEAGGQRRDRRVGRVAQQRQLAGREEPLLLELAARLERRRRLVERRRLLPALAHPAEPRERVVDGRALRRRARAQIGAAAVQRLGRAGVAAREEREVALQQLGVDRVGVRGAQLL